MREAGLGLILLLGAAAPLSGQTAADSSLASPPVTFERSTVLPAGRSDTMAHFRPPPGGLWRPVWKPGLVIGASFLLDQGTRTVVQDIRSGPSNTLARIGNGFGDYRYFLPVLGAGLLAGVVFDRPGMTQWAWQSMEAGALAGVTVAFMKKVSGRPRPFQTGDADELHPFSQYASFPSGHTAAVVAFATVLAPRVHDPWLRGMVYGGAALTGFARMNDDKHWLSDVLVGAVVGHVAGKIVNRLHRSRSHEPTAPLP